MKRLALAAATTLAACSPTPTAPAPPPTTTTAPPAPTTAPTTAPPPQVAAHPPRPVPAEVGATTPEPTTEGMPGQEATLAAIARCESGGDYNAENPTSTASGRYQVLDSTWDGYGGYERASDAPPDVQEAWAREAYARAGTTPWRASRSCWQGAA